MDKFTAWYFDGHSAAATRATLARAADELVLLRDDNSLLRRTPLADLRCGERFELSPLLVAFPGGASLQVDHGQAAERVEHLLGYRASAAERLQRSWPGVVLAVALVVAGLVAFYLRGLPWIAEQAAAAMPPAMEQRMGNELLSLLDKRMLAPSKDYEVDRTQKAQITQRFDKFAARSAAGVDYRVEFRSVRGGGGVNAFTLPGGTIVVLDGLVAASENEEQILAVMAHELGHVALRHPIKRVTKGVGLGMLAGLLWGDVSSVAANVPAVLGTLSYSRDEEREADAFALRVLTENGLDAQPLIDVLQTLFDNERRGGAVPDFLSSHPSTAERVEDLRKTLPERR